MFFIQTSMADRWANKSKSDTQPKSRGYQATRRQDRDKRDSRIRKPDKNDEYAKGDGARKTDKSRKGFEDKGGRGLVDS